MPGHKLGRGIPGELMENLASLDLTEIPGTDNLHFPSGAIKEAMRLASLAFGSDETFFLVNGSTCGIHAMLMTICKPGDRLIVSRNCHKSVINGMMLAEVEPIYIKPEYDSEFGISTVLTPREVENAIIQHPDAVGVFVTSPNYYGICSGIKEIARVMHSYGKILAVDEAHGAHLIFNDKLPESAMQSGADICVQSAHKTLPAFTQGAYLHVKGNNIDLEKLKYNLQMIQTSSPSYVIMAFLDIAREIMQKNGSRLLDEQIWYARYLENGLNKLENLLMLTEKRVDKGRLDKTRVVINVKRLGKTGFDIEEMLRKDYSIQVEMSDLNNIVCIGTVSDSRTDYEKLYSALKEISCRFMDMPPLSGIYMEDINIPEQSVGLRSIMYSKSIYIKLAEAIGRISKQMIIPYPPGIPAVCPGELITEQVVKYIGNIVRHGGTVNGLNDSGEISVIGE